MFRTGRDEVLAVEVLQAWLDLQLSRLPRRRRLAETIRQARGRWSALIWFLADGRIDLEADPVERAIRPMALGREGRLFAGSEGGASRRAIVASPIETADPNSVEPFAWLHNSLATMVDGHPVSRPDDLPPWSGSACCS